MSLWLAIVSHYLGDTEEHRKVSCLERIYPFSLRVRRLASRHSKGVEYWGSGLEAIDPMVITERRLTLAARTSSGAKGSRGSAQPFGTSSSCTEGLRKAEAGGSVQPFGTSPS